MRSLLIDGWTGEQLIVGFGVGGGFCAVTLAWASAVARRKTTRR